MPNHNPQDNQNKPGNRPQGGRPYRDDKPKSEYEENVLQVDRVSRTVKGGKRMRFRACVVIGDAKSRVGMGIAKGADVSTAVNKAVTKAKKLLLVVPIVNDTIPHDVKVKFKSAIVYMKPAPQGSGVIAGGAVRSVMNLAGVGNVVCKMLGTQNKINNVKAVFKALGQLRTRRLGANAIKK